MKNFGSAGLAKALRTSADVVPGLTPAMSRKWISFDAFANRSHFTGAPLCRKVHRLSPTGPTARMVA